MTTVSHPVSHLRLPAEYLGQFPSDFRWGLATAAYQIEGGATAGGRGPSIWDTFSHTPGLSLHGDNGDIACDHYARWASDLDLLASLGVRDYRLSVSWSRLQPLGQGSLNPEGVAFYRRLLTGLRERGIRGLVTLYHWDLPQPLEDHGGWPNRDTAHRFADYAGMVLRELGDLAEDWITLNEPWCSAILGYGTGAHAPGRRNDTDALAAAHHLNLAHGLASSRIRAERPGVRVGVSNIVTDIVPRTLTAEDLEAARRLDAGSNRLFLDPIYTGDYSPLVRGTFSGLGLEDLIREGDLQLISQPTDFAGINHYQRVLAWHDVSAGYLQVGERPADPATTSFGWSVLPESLTAVLRRIASEFTSLPIYVTENGASFHDYVDPNGEVVDSERVEYLSGYIAAAADAISHGVDLRGYYAWSFLDNFEWAEGYSKRFGLVYVDYRTQERIPKLSAKWYQRLIADFQTQGVSPEPRERAGRPLPAPPIATY
jgi:beta-glucosidase